MKRAAAIDLFGEVKARLNIIDVMKLYGISLNRHNKAVCCFHKEKTPSLVVYPYTQSFYCYGCGIGGSAIDFVQKIYNLEPLEAAKKLDIDFNLNLLGQELTPQKRAEIAAIRAEREEQAAIAAAYKKWENEYWNYLCENIRLLEDLRDLSTPTPEVWGRGEIDNYVTAINRLQILEYHMDILDNGTIQDKTSLYLELSRTVKK